MKKIYTSCLILLYSFTTNAQNTLDTTYVSCQLNLDLGLTTLSGLPDQVDQQVSTAAHIGLMKNIHVAKKRYYIATGLEYVEGRYIADGHFTQNGNEYNFELTPGNYKQHETVIRSLRVPVIFKLMPRMPSQALGIGVYADYILDAKSKYKIDTEHYQSDAPIENKFGMGLEMDMEFLLTKKTFRYQRFTSVLGYGFRYQLTNYLKGSRSFHPLSGFIRLGFALW